MSKKKQIKKAVTLRFRVTKDLANIIRHRSMFYFDGNMSEFFRYCVDNFISPNKKLVAASKLKDTKESIKKAP